MNSVISAVSILCLISTLLGCSKQLADESELIVKLGHAGPMSGPQAHIGKDSENGARLAVEDVNAAQIKLDGRILKFELINEDDQADPHQATLAAQRIINQKVSAVIGHVNSGATIPASKLYFKAMLPQVSPSSTNPTFTHQGFKTAFRVMPNDEHQGRALGNYAINNLHIKSVAIISDSTAYGDGLAAEFRKSLISSSVEIVAVEHTDDKTVDFSAILTRIKVKKPDLVFFGCMDPQAIAMAQQMKKMNMKMPLLMGDGGCTTGFVKNAAGAAEGHYCSLPGKQIQMMPGGAQFLERYKSRFNLDVQLYAPYAYDAVMVVVDAIKRSGSTKPADILATLPTTNYSGITTQITFDKQGDLRNSPITFYTAKNNKWINVGAFSVGSGI